MGSYIFSIIPLVIYYSALLYTLYNIIFYYVLLYTVIFYYTYLFKLNFILLFLVFVYESTNLYL